jgi:maltose alpha-D-glucosyltransferase/alpha-amylase
MEFLDEFKKHYEEVKDYGYMCIVEGNHDLHPRISYGRSPGEILQVYLFTMTMPGVPFLYYGDEIGIRSIDGLPCKEGSYDRSNIRSPMQWDNHMPNAGFSKAPADKLYLPIDPDANRPAVAQQESDPRSLLNQTKALIALKGSLKALAADASWKIIYAERGNMPLLYERARDDQRLVIAINPTLSQVQAEIPSGTLTAQPVTRWGQEKAFRKKGDAWTITLAPASGGIYEVK